MKNHSIQRKCSPGIRFGILLFLLTGLSGTTALAQYTPFDPTPILFPTPPTGETVKQRIPIKREQACDVFLEKDEFLEISIEQIDLPIQPFLLNQKGEVVALFFSQVGNGGIQDIRYIAPEKGAYRVVLSPQNLAKARDGDGEYSFTIKAKRPATRLDQAYTLEWQARKIVTSDPDTSPAIPIAQRGVVLFRELGDQRGEAQCLFQMGRAYLYSDEPEKVFPVCSASLAIFENLKDLRSLNRNLNVLGTASIQIGEYYPAVEYLKRALQISRLLDNKNAVADTLRNLGNVYDRLGDTAAALDACRQALTLFRELQNVADQTAVQITLASLLNRAGKTEEARGILQNLYAPLRMGEADPEDRLTLISLFLKIGGIDLQLHNTASASEFARMARQRARQFKLPSLEAQALHLEGLVSFEKGQYSEALEQFNAALAILKSTRIEISRLDILTDIARTEFKLGNVDEARKLMFQVVEATESQRSTIEDQELRTFFLGSVQSRYEFTYSLLMELHRLRPNEGLDVLAFQTSERAKARTLIDILQTKSILIEGDQAIALQRRKLQNRINEANRELTGLSTSSEDTKRRAEIEKDLATAIGEYHDLNNQLQKTNPKYFRLTEPVALDIQGIRAQLADDTVLLEYALGTEKSFLWVVTPTGLKSYELPNRAKVEQLARRTYDTLTARGLNPKYEQSGGPEYQARIRKTDAEYATVSKELAEILLGPVAAELKGKRLLVVGDGPLLYLPFAALPLPDSGQPLVTRCEITQLPSISTLSVLRQDSAGRPTATKTVAVLADPVFESSDPRIKGTTVASPGKPSAPEVGPTSDITRAVADIDGPDRAAILKRLPFTRREAEAIGALVPEAKRRIGLDFAASRETVFGENLGQYRFVHFATHGLLNSTQPDLSGIVLSMVNEKGEPQDGFLHAYEVFNLKMPVEMVVLSGCRTGLGKEIRGEGMIGLTRAFLYAGAERVMVSLWSIPDESTSSLMTDTYTGLLKQNQRPAAALRAAQLKMMKNPRWAAPYYWAAFTLQGEPR